MKLADNVLAVLDVNKHYSCYNSTTIIKHQFFSLIVSDPVVYIEFTTLDWFRR